MRPGLTTRSSGRRRGRMVHAQSSPAPLSLLSFGLMKPSLILLALVFLLTGCIPLRQYAHVSGPLHPSVGLCDDRYLLVEIDMNREKIVAEQSHIADPSGKRYTIQVEPHQYDIDQKFEALRADVYPCRVDGSRIRHWSNGIWSFHFVVETNGVAQANDEERRWPHVPEKESSARSSSSVSFAFDGVRTFGVTT